MPKHNYATDPPPDLSKEPKWLQNYFEDMRRDLVRKDKKIKDLSELHPGSNVVMGGRLGEPDTTLPPDSRIFFYAGEGRDMLTDMIEVRFDHQDGQRLYIASYGSRGVRIVPSASNSFYLELREK
jgi:hypothetical protein